MTGSAAIRVAILDDWQGIARRSADWSGLERKAELVFFHEAFADTDEAAQRLVDFDVIVAMRERTAFPATLIDRLPNLRLFSFTGRRASAIDLVALAARGVVVSTTDDGDTGPPTAELALLLMLAAARHLPAADAAIRAGLFQAGVPPGVALSGKTLGLIGLGRLGQQMASFGKALGMQVLAWSENLTVDEARNRGATYAGLDELLGSADAVSLHLVLSARTRGLIGRPQLERLKLGAILINTSRGLLIEEAALIEALQAGRLTAALDVFNHEPLSPDHPFRTLPNTVLTPHLGYVTLDVMSGFYRQSVENVMAFLAGAPIRLWQAGG